MSRPKKDGQRVSLFLDRQVMERLRAYADERGQTVTTAMERLIMAKLNDIDAGEDDPPSIDGSVTVCGGIKPNLMFTNLPEE